jgi:hypothetical protein
MSKFIRAFGSVVLAILLLADVATAYKSGGFPGGVCYSDMFSDFTAYCCSMSICTE